MNQKYSIEDLQKEFGIPDFTPEDILRENRERGLLLYSREMFAYLTGKTKQQIKNEHDIGKIDVLGTYMKNRIRRYYLDSDYCVVKRSELEQLLSINR